MKINVKERLKNKLFVASMAALIISFVYDVLGELGIVPSVSENTILSFADIAIKLLAGFGILNDPTTPGFGDSARALTYGTNYDIRFTEEASESDEGERKATSNGNV